MKKAWKMTTLGLITIFIHVSGWDFATPGRVPNGSDLSSVLNTRKVFVLAIGINEYKDPEIPNLKGALNDATGISESFDGEKIVLLNEEATKERILKELDNLSREISSNDLFVFSYSGNGDEFGATFTLLASDSILSKQEKTGISTLQLREYFRRIRAKNKLIIVDSCRSSKGFEASTDAFLENDTVVKSLRDENVLFIGTDELAFEDESSGKPHGKLSLAIINGLSPKGQFKVKNTKELQAYMYKVWFDDAEIRDKFSPRIIARGEKFDLSNSVVKQEAKSTESSKTKPAEKADPIPEKPDSSKIEKPQMRVGVQQIGEKSDQNTPWNGESYALLIANREFDNSECTRKENPSSNCWKELKNPMNDVIAVKNEIIARYGFKEENVVVRSNLRTNQIYDAIEEYKTFKFKNPDEDQLFIFLAGHGIARSDGKGGYFVGYDSGPPPVTRRNMDRYVSLDEVTNQIDGIQVGHVMLVVDACYAGTMWEPPVQMLKTSGTVFEKRENRNSFAGTKLFKQFAFGFVKTQFSYDQDKLTRFRYAKREMGSRSRSIITSGDRPVYDSVSLGDGTISDHSPFAIAFLEALRTDGGELEVLTIAGIKLKIDGLEIRPQIGRLSGTDGEFAFVKRDKRAMKTESD